MYSSPLYSPFFKLGRKPPSRPLPTDPAVPSKLLTSLDQIEAAVKTGSLDPAVKSALEEQLTQILVMGLKAKYSAEDAQQLFLDAVKDLDPFDDDFDDDADEAQPEMPNFTSVLE